MSAVYGIAGFVDGFINGRDIKNSWQDRKDDKARQKRMDDLTFTQDARAAEEHGARMRSWNEQFTEWDQKQADEKAYRDAQEAAIAAADGAMGANPPDQTNVSSSNAEPSPPAHVAGVAESLGLPVTGYTPPTSLVQPNFSAPVSAPSPQAAPTPRQVAPGPAGGPPPTRTPGPAGGPPPTRTPGYGAVPPPQSGPRGLSPAISDELYQNGAIGPVTQRGPAEVAAMTEGQNPLSPDYNHNFGYSLVPDAVEVGKRGIAVAGNVAKSILWDAPMVVGKHVADSGNSGYNWLADNVAEPAANYIMGANPEPGHPGSVKATGAVQGVGIGASATARGAQPPQPALGPRKSNVPASAPAATKQLAETARGALESVNSPDVAAASQAAAATTAPAMGVKPGDKVSEEQRNRGAKAWMDRYLDVGAPIVMKEMLKRGDFAGAQKYQEFLDKETTKAGMENWARAAFAATVGDMDTFADEIMQAYNRLDYFPDGTTIVKEKSGFTYDPKTHAIAGAHLTFKDEKTGTTFEQVFDDPNDLVRMGITLLSPEQAFQHYAEQTAAATPTTKPIDPAEVQQQQDKKAEDIRTAAVKLVTESKGLDGQPTLSMEEAIQQILAADAMVKQRLAQPNPGPEQRQGPPAPPPVAYRPAN